jgi:hypothetical protein
MNMIHWIKTIAKAIAAGATAFGAAFAVAANDGFITSGEWVTIAVATLVAIAAVWAVPNADPATE